MSLDEKTFNMTQLLSGLKLTKDQLLAESQRSLMKIKTFSMALQEETQKLSLYQEMLSMQEKLEQQKTEKTQPTTEQTIPQPIQS